MNLPAVVSTLLALALFSAEPARSQNWAPTKTTKIVVPASAGSAPDTFARIYADELQKTFGQPFVVENKPGAAGMIGTDAVAKAAPDGTTLLYGFNSAVTMNPHLYRKIPYNAERDLSPVGIVLGGGYVLIANNDLPVSNVRGLIGLAKSKPGQLNYGSSGNGSAGHLGMLLLEQATDIKLTHIPYKQAAISDLIAGRIQVLIEPAATAVTQVKAGRVKALAVTGSTRIEALPNVPTVDETVPNFELSGWNAFWLPGGTPEPIVRRYQKEIARITQLPAVATRAKDLGYRPMVSTPQEMADRITRESKMWGEMIKLHNITLD